jgi:hypothetical protein
MKRTLIVILAAICAIPVLKSQTIKSPSEFLGYELGTQFTYHHKAVEYFKYIADASPIAEYREYGYTCEGRPLGVCIISSEENLARIEEYRMNNLVKTGLAKGEFTGKQVPFIWLAYNVHGNEATGMEASLKTLYTLVTGTYPNVSEYLKSCIIIIDPCQNPDGHELYTSRYRESMSLLANPDPNAWEHNQGWPGARLNHYLFDLNRDWTWQTQIENRQRLKFYSSFMPQVHADFHEMGTESTFFFAPGAEPWHTVLTPWQHEFHKIMGKGTAEMFDKKFRLYFTKENFDLFYPSYGDTWPLFNGAIGFTYEQAGGMQGGRALLLESGDTLTLAERIDGHFTASMSTIKVAFENREKLVSEFNKFFEDGSTKPDFKYKSVIIKGSNEKSNVSELLNLLDHNQIKYSFAGDKGRKFKGFDYLENKDGEVTVGKGDILVSAYQPQSHMMQVLFEPDSKTVDSLSYDLTAWALPYIYNLRAYAVSERIAADTASTLKKIIINERPNDEPYGYIVDFTGFDELKFMASIYRKEIKVRYSLKPFQLNGTTFNRGSLIIARGDNKNFKGDLDKCVADAANECQVKLIPASTGLVDSGKDFGSGYSPLMKKRSIAVMLGEDTPSGSAGELWYFFERELNYPVTMINTSDAKKADLSKYDIILLPSGSYKKLKDTIVDFVKRGGKVIAFENAIGIFAGEKSTALAKAVETKKAEDKITEKKIKSDDSTLLKKYEYTIDRRYSLIDKSTGSISRVKLDDTHPYAFGMGKEWFVIKRTEGYPYLANGNNIGYITEKDPVAGFSGYKFRGKIKNTLVIGSENIGKGEVIYVTDDPYFRAFWKSGRVLLGNMVLR